MERVAKLQSLLDAQANPKTKLWWEGYLKGAIPFRGVKMAGIRAALHDWIKAEGIGTRLPIEDQLELALALIRERCAEDKLAGILFLQEVLIPSGVLDCHSIVPRLAGLFEQCHIRDWNTCDWFCVKVLGPLIQQQGEACARAIAAWHRAEGMWQRRAAGVAFVNLARDGDANFLGFTEMLLTVCAATVRTRERFAQTGTGWVLRELSLAEPESVARFVEAHLADFSAEGLRRALAKMPGSLRRRLTRLHGEQA